MEEIVREALEFRSDNIAFLNESRQNAIEDMQFELGGESSWDPRMWSQRGDRPKITINTPTTKKNRLANDLRDLNPEIKIIPTDDEFSEHARIKTGLIKKIQDLSGAESVFDQCFSQGLAAGFSFMKVSVDYESSQTFDMTPKIKFLPNNLGVYVDHYTQSPCYLDMKWGLCEEKISLDQFKQKYSDKTVSGFPSDAVNLDKSIILGDFYKIKETPKKLLMISNGEQIIEGFKDDLRISQALEYEINGEKVWTVLQERKSYQNKLHWYKLSVADILDEREILGKYIPIIPYEARVVWVQGQKYLVSFLRDLKEPARLKNYAKSVEAEMLGMSTLTDVMAPAAAISNHIEYWESRNKKRWPFLPYDHQDKQGNPIPPPQAINFSGNFNQFAAISQGYNADIDEISGMWQDNVGGPSALRSGVAIDLKQNQGNQNNFDFIDNFTTRTLQYLGVVLNDLIDNYYDTERNETITGKDGRPELVKLNQPGGITLGETEYQVKVSIGSAVESKRKESNELIMELAKAFPERLQSAVHIMANNLDGFKDKEELVKLLKAQLGPELAQVLDEDDPQRVFVENAQLKQQMQQQQAQLEQATELIKSMQIDYQKAMDVQRLKGEQDMQKENLRSQNDLQKETVKGEYDLQKTELQNQGKVLSQIADGVQIALSKISELEARVSGNTLTLEGENE